MTGGRLGKETFTRWDAAERLDSEEAIAAYLEACAQEDDPRLMVAAVDDVRRARAQNVLLRRDALNTVDGLP